MLLLSLVVTALTHYLVSLSNLRGRRLRAGLASLLARLDPRIGFCYAVPLANAILKDPLIAASGGRLASFIHRAQLSVLCLRMAAEVADAPEEDPHRYADPRESLYWTLRAHGIADPGAALDRIPRHALELEQTQPELTELARLEIAIVSAAGAPFVAKINACFDQTMDGVSARFTAAVRAITVAAALGLASFLQIDCLALVNHLAMDDAVRGQVVKAALEGKSSETALALHAAMELELVHIPASWDEWWRGWCGSGGGAGQGRPLGPAHVGGVLLTAVLLSLGAPFWYNLIGGTLRLRPAPTAPDGRDRSSHARRAEKPAVSPLASTSLPASSTRHPESDEWLPSPESRYSAVRR